MFDRIPRPLWRAGLLAGLIALATAWLAVPGPAAAPVGKTRTGSAPAAQKPLYNRDIRPILAENCFACHGPDKAARKGDLRLDLRDEAIKSAAFVPGKPEQSSLVERIYSDNPGQMMPPKKSPKKLTPAQKDMLKRWVASGAEYQPHWSYIPPTRPALPAVKNTTWVRNPIDAFVLAELEKRGLQPAPEADRRTLARRLSLDLRGLPPAMEEVEAFVNDTQPGAYERYVEQMLASPYWGEHRGRYWLDAARYGDTHGIHFDNYREMWAYRDWVIGALNRNLPFDQFTIEQIAGDLLPARTTDQQVASGFNRCNITTNEGGVIPDEYLVLYTRDRTETVSQVWMGMTAGCAVCHDHKLDPLSQREFYQMASFFNNTTQGAMDGNIKDTPPTITVPRMEDQPHYITLYNLLGEARRRVDERKQSARADFTKWFKSASAEQVLARIPTDGLHLHAPLSEGKGNKVEVVVAGVGAGLRAGPRTLTLPGDVTWDNGTIAAKALKVKAGVNLRLPDVGDFDNKQAFSFGAWVKFPFPRQIGPVFSRMDEGSDYRGWDLWLENGQFGTHIVHRWPMDAIKVVSQTRAKANQWNHVFITYDGSSKADGVKIYLNGELQALRTVTADGLKGTTRTKTLFRLAQRSGASRLDGISVQDVRIYSRLLPAEQVRHLRQSSQAAYLLASTKGKPAAVGAGLSAGPEVNALFDWWLAAEDAEYRKLQAAYDRLAQEEGAIRARGTLTHVMQEKDAKPMAFILYRGDYEKRRDEVGPQTPKVLPAMPADLPRNRLGFAKWLTQPGHPLTARVTVNRFWQEVFGTGIVRTSGDFGTAGELPSHPELLDWLALSFQQGWDIKQLFRLMVTSATYRQAATTTPEKAERDPFNTYLSRGPRFRMDAEMVRDHALAASGLLVTKFGGPSVKPYQPDGVWEAVAMIGSDTRDYKRDSGENLYRRSMYTFWKRSAPPASMDIFNAPSRETCAVRRERTNTPLQALVTLNDVQFVEAARVLAERTLKEGGAKVEDRMDYLARKQLSRPFRPEELKVVRGLLDELLGYYRGNVEEAKKLIAFGESKADPTADAATLAGWTMLVNSLMNLDEVLNK
jgi:mono/diheme cytochrome c family protein